MNTKPFEVTRFTIKEPLHSNTWTALKCTGLLIVTLLVVLVKTAGYVTLGILIVLGFIVKLMHKFIDWLVKKIR